jgi:serine O-acetyltransferase
MDSRRSVIRVPWLTISTGLASLEWLLAVLQTIAEDFQIIFERDPAAKSGIEVLLCYPGFQALVSYRLAHRLHGWGMPLVPRLISHLTRWLTGVEIHPGAQIGRGVFIDHGMGVVIGETAIVGNYALIYQGVTLGGTGKGDGKRHPTLGENVVVGAGAKVLGNIEVGDGVRIGAGSVVLRDVPADCTVVGIPGRIIYRSGVRVDPLEHGNLPDSEARVIRALLDRIDALEAQMQGMQERLDRDADRALVANGPLALDREQADLQRLKCAAVLNAALEASPGLLGSLTAQTLDHPEGRSCLLKDREIESFLNGTGI